MNIKKDMTIFAKVHQEGEFSTCDLNVRGGYVSHTQHTEQGW